MVLWVVPPYKCGVFVRRTSENPNSLGLIDYRLLVETTCCPETVYKQNVLLTTVFTGRRDEWICVVRAAAAAEKNDKGR